VFVQLFHTSKRFLGWSRDSTLQRLWDILLIQVLSLPLAMLNQSCSKVSQTTQQTAHDFQKMLPASGPFSEQAPGY
jgi:hypothetical protein